MAVSSKIKRVLKLLFMILLFMFFLLLFSGFSDHKKTIHYEGEGDCDLRGHDFMNHYAIIQSDTLDFFPNQYLSPQEARKALPSGYSKVQYATERIVFLLPDNDIYSISFQIPGVAGKIYINGKLVKESGRIGTNIEETQPGHSWCILNAVPEDGKVELVIQAANFLYDGKVVSLPVIRISRADSKLDQLYAYYFQSLFVFGGLTLAALLLIGMWIFYPSQTYNIWFGLLCLVMAVRTGVTNELFLWLFPKLTFPVIFRMNVLSTLIIICLVVLYFESIYPRIFQKTPAGIYVFCALYGGAELVLPINVVTATYKYSYPALGVFLVYGFYCLFRRIWKADLISMLTVSGIVILVLCSAVDLFHYMGSRKVLVTVAETGLMIFALLQMLSIFIRNAQEIASVRRKEQKLAMEKEVLEEANRMKTEFLANISHELKTPLTVMSVCAQSAGMEIERANQNERKKILENKMKLISSEAERLSMMVGQILAATKIEENRMVNEMSSCFVDEIIHEVVETYFPLLNHNNNRLNIHIMDDVLPVMGDAQNLSRVFVNLLSNAVRHTQNGTITITVKTEQGFVVIRMEDTGSGMTSEQLNGIFKRFHAYSGTGTGLGLYISKHIIEAHNGEIKIESRIGEGTRVTIKLPCA